MNNIVKQKYVSCNLKVIQFNVEQGFATSTVEECGRFTTNYNTNTLTMRMNNTNGHYQNEQYDNTIDWFNGNQL